MEKSSEHVEELLGELIAHRYALKAVLLAHPAQQLLHGRLAAAKEQGIVDALGAPQPDSVLRAFERAMDEIAAMLPTRLPPE